MIRTPVAGAGRREAVGEGTNRDVRAALREADWEALLPRLVGYAERRLRRVGWIVGKDEEPSPVSVEDVINDAIDRCLTGSRTWNTDDPPELGAFLCGVIRSITSISRKKQKRSKTTSVEDIGVEAADPAPSIESVMSDAGDEGRGAVRAAVEACVKGDDKLESLYLAIIDGNLKREEIASTLGWTPDEVTAARNKLQRRLVAQFPAQFASFKKTRGRT
jgi:DNA-directed RNA polymerase specialized sigma24 family protein